MRFAKILKKGVLVKSVPFDGAKPLVESVPEIRRGFRAVMSYEETESSIRTTWDYFALSDEEMRTIEEEEAGKPLAEPTDEEALTRYANTITGASDHTLVEAAETLIEQRIKEES